MKRRDGDDELWCVRCWSRRSPAAVKVLGRLFNGGMEMRHEELLWRSGWLVMRGRELVCVRMRGRELVCCMGLKIKGG